MMAEGASQRRSRFTDGHFAAATRLAARTHPISRPHGPPGRSAQTHWHPYPAAIQHPAAKWLDLGQYLSPPCASGDDPHISHTVGESARTVLVREACGPAHLCHSTLQPSTLRKLEQGLSRPPVCDAHYRSG